MIKKLCIITGSRSDYDLLKPLMIKIKKDDSFKLLTLVTGSHFLKSYGQTYKKIQKDGLKIFKKIKILDNEDKNISVIKSISLGVIKFGKILKKINPDAIIVLGDRYEIFAAVISAGFLRIPIIHLSGGEVTSGAIDENVRHSISKFSSYHFVSNKKYKKRVIQLGEDPRNIFCVGSTSIENIKEINTISLKLLQKEINFKFKKKNFLITYHPETYKKDGGVQDFKILLKVLAKLKNIGLIFTRPNADFQNSTINNLIKKFTKKNKNAKYYTSLGQKKYFSCLKYIDAIIGNSSSGIIEAPSFKKPTINLGSRQKGRILASSIVSLDDVTKKNLYRALKIIESKKFKNNLKKVKNPYYMPSSSSKILKKIKKIKFSKTNKKLFFDIPLTK